MAGIRSLAKLVGRNAVIRWAIVAKDTALQIPTAVHPMRAAQDASRKPPGSYRYGRCRPPGGGPSKGRTGLVAVSRFTIHKDVRLRDATLAWKRRALVVGRATATVRWGAPKILSMSAPSGMGNRGAALRQCPLLFQAGI